MQFALLGGFVILLGLLGKRAGRNSYVLVAAAALVASALLYYR